MNDRIGCFGSVLYHAADSARCQACPLFQDCAAQVTKNAAELQEWYEALIDAAPNARSKRKMGQRGIKTIRAPEAMPIKRATVTATKPLDASGKVPLNKKPREHVERWCARGVDFAAALRGENPFKGCGNKFAEVAMDFFLANKGKKVHKHALNDEFQKTCGWAAGTAGSHVNIVFDAFAYLGIIDVTEQEATLRTE